MALISDGKAVDVTVSANVTKDTVVVAEGWAGIAMNDASSGDTVALAVDQRVYELNVGGITANKGDILYVVAATGALTTTSSGNFAFCKVVESKDSNNIAWVKLLENREEVA